MCEVVGLIHTRNLLAMTKKKFTLEYIEENLGFNPISETYNCFMVSINAKKAQFILDYFNNDNRLISQNQVNKIYRSIQNDNWLFDGSPMTFNIEGNLTEFQHRLKAIAKCNPDREFIVPVVVGVVKEAFTKTATNKQRKPIDEIQRKYKKTSTSEVSVLGDILKRRKKDRLSMQNAISSYEDWCRNIISAIAISGNYENVTAKFSLQRKTLRAYIALCERFNLLEECQTFLEILEEELNPDVSSPSTITSEFVDFWNYHAVDLSNEKRMDFLYAMLCKATDLIILRDDGMINFNYKASELEHVPMERLGVYRKFLA